MNFIKKLLLVSGLFIFLIACSDSTTKGPFKEVANPAPTEKPEVLEFFAYFCPHCYQIDAKVDAWKNKLPKSVHFKRVPLTLGSAGGRIYSRLYYISESLGVLDRSHVAMFQLFHNQKQQISSELQLKNFFLSLGVNENDFDKAIKDPVINLKVEQAEAMAKQFRIIGVPGFVVNGTYFTDVATSGGEKEMFDQINRLLRKKD